MLKLHVGSMQATCDRECANLCDTCFSPSPVDSAHAYKQGRLYFSPCRRHNWADCPRRSIKTIMPSEAHSVPPSPLRRRSRSYSPYHRNCVPDTATMTVVSGGDHTRQGDHAMSKSMPDLRPRFVVRRADERLISERNFCGMFSIHKDHLKPRSKVGEGSPDKGRSVEGGHGLEVEGDHHYTTRSRYAYERGRGTNRSKRGTEECHWTESGYDTEGCGAIKSGRGTEREHGTYRGGKGPVALGKSVDDKTKGKKSASKKLEFESVRHWVPLEQSQSSPCLPTSKDMIIAPQWSPRERIQPPREHFQPPTEHFQPPMANDTGGPCLHQSPGQHNPAVTNTMGSRSPEPRPHPAPTPTPTPAPVDPELLNRYLPRSETCQKRATLYLPRSETYVSRTRTLAATIEDKIERLKQECCEFLVSFNALLLLFYFVVDVSVLMLLHVLLTCC